MTVIRTGTILTGDHAGWTIRIRDDRSGETGGYFLYLIRDQLHGFDAWFETLEQLEYEISEFEVNWR
ncbi:hypothetical protein [Pseudomonas sp. A-RE-19]|uniref:hypothetical protein n=1 Tax=Pseudomonas sp. A-RE-19 TaxID=2832401 RepID=UPI001CBBD73A|nr:hypothetical protein [Pseudomonas sp. A-RE-19]